MNNHFSIRPAKPEEAGLVLEFIKKPALTVYRSIGAVPMDEWTVQRLDEAALRKFAEEE